MDFAPFHEYFPEIADSEALCFRALNDEALPEGEYQLLESYCLDPACDCRRVFLNVFTVDKNPRFLACIAYGWESLAYYANWFGFEDADPELIKEIKGPSLNMGGGQSEVAELLLERVKLVLKDPDYIRRIENHYYLFKDSLKVRSHSHRRQKIASKVGRNDPCPCGSAKKFKKCCALAGLKTLEEVIFNKKNKDQVFQFQILLKETNPPVWRRIQVPATYTFWDFHVAIQDAMGWEDAHLHEFEVQNTTIGVPSNDQVSFFEEEITLAGWKENLADYFSDKNKRADYLYDFGDAWEHSIKLEKTLKRDSDKTYPRCLEGKGACPPEDCGGVYAYEQLCDGEHEWLKEKEGFEFDPEAFDLDSIRFSDPKKRLDYILKG